MSGSNFAKTKGGCLSSEGKHAQSQSCSPSKSQRPKKSSKSNVSTKIPWTKEEDAQLLQLISKHGLKNWAVVSSEMQDRVASQCGERWFNHLCPAISAREWSSEENDTILKGFAEVGGTWDVIAARLPGRSEIAIRTHFNNTLRKTPAALAQGLRKSPASTQRSWTSIPVDCVVHIMHCLGRSFAQWAILRVVCNAWHTLSLNEQWLGALEGVVSSPAALKPLSSLIGLQTLEVSLHDYDLKFLAPLSTLKTLHLANFKITHESLNSLSRLVALRKLCLRSCHGVYAFGSFTSLVELEIIGCDVANKALSGISKLSHLHHLSLRGCYHISDPGVQFLLGLNQLESLDIALCPVGPDVLASLWQLPSLTSLCMDKIGVNDAGIKHLSSFQKLRQFSAELYLTDVGLPYLIGVPWMESLDLQHGDISDAGLHTLAKMTQLRTLNLATCSSLHDVTFLSLLTNLSTLDISSTRVGATVSHLTALTQLTMKTAYSFQGVMPGLATMLQLQVLDISNNRVIHDDWIRPLSRLSNLRILNLSFCNLITGVGIEGFTALEELSIRACCWDAAGCAILATLPRLRVVEVSSPYAVTPAVQKQGLIKINLNNSYLY